MKKHIIFFTLFLIINYSMGQDVSQLDFIFKNNSDKVYCFITDIVRSGGNVTKIKYIDLNKKEHIIKGSEIKTVKSLRVAGKTLDYIPLKASKPNSYHRHIQRKIDGKIKIYVHIRLIASTDKS